jgi:uncharacterized membrane protein YhaH (DUF805 family)
MNNIMGAFTGFEGRLNRQRWWIGVIILAIIGIIISWILGAIFGTGLIMNPADATDPAALLGYIQKAGWIGLIVAIIFAYPYLAIAIKRRHDRNNNGYDVIGFLILELLINLLNALGLALGMLSGLLGIILLVYAIYLLVVLGFLKGTAGPNNYGPDPLQG